MVPAAPSAKWPSSATDSIDGSHWCQVPMSLQTAQTSAGDAVVVTVRSYSKVMTAI